MEYLLNYMDDYLIDDLKNTLNESTLQYFISEKQNVIEVVEFLKQNGISDIYMAIMCNCDIFFEGTEKLKKYILTHDNAQFTDYIYNN